MSNSNKSLLPIRGHVLAPDGENIFLSGYPGIEVSHDGSTYVDPDTMDCTLKYLSDNSTVHLCVLTETHELPEDADACLQDRVDRYGMTLELLPTEDCGVPDDDVDAMWDRGQKFRARIFQQNKKIATVCHHGAGRSGMFAASALVQQGYHETVAIKAVKTALNEALSIQKQIDWASKPRHS